MIQRNKKRVRSVSKDTARVVLILFFVKVIGFLKQAVIASRFGTGLKMDAYLIVSDFVGEIGIVMFSSLSISFLNDYVLFSHKTEKKEKDRFTVSLLRTFIPISLLLAAGIIVLSRQLSFLLAPGFTVQERGYVQKYLCLLAVTVFNSCCGTVFTAILEAEKDFVPGKISGFLQSICIILGCAALSPLLGVESLIYSYLLYCVIQNLFLFYKTLKYVDYREKGNAYGGILKKMIRQSIPLFISNAVVQINAVIDKAISSGLGSGNVSALSYGYFVFSSIHSILIGGSCSVIFSHFSSYVAENREESLRDLFRDSVNLLALVLIPVQLFLCLYAEPVARFLYGRGSFDETSIFLTSRALTAYSAGLLFLGIKDVTIRLNYAFQNMKIPMQNGVVSVGINIILSILFSQRWGGMGIALASSIAGGIGMILMLLSSKKYIRDLKKIFKRDVWCQLCIAGFGAVCLTKLFDGLCIISNGMIAMLVSGCVLFGTYFSILILVKCQYVLMILKKVVRK